MFSNETKILGRDSHSFLVLKFGLDVLNGVGSFNLKGDSLAEEVLDENLHPESFGLTFSFSLIDIFLQKWGIYLIHTNVQLSKVTTKW